MRTIVTYDEDLLSDEHDTRSPENDEVFVIHRKTESENNLLFHKSFDTSDAAEHELASMNYDETYPLVFLYHLTRNSLTELVIESCKYSYDFVYNMYVASS